MGKGEYDEIKGTYETRNSFLLFSGLVILTQIIGLIMVILCGVWMGNYRGGFSWSNDPNLEFNYHPLFMTLGLIFLYGDAILLYRVFRNVEKMYVKLAHALIQILALIFAAIGLKAVFDSHNLVSPPRPNLYSLHSWFGLSAIILFTLQWISGFVSFLYPKLSETIRRAYMPSHRQWGIIIFIMVCATALMGITEKAIFSVTDYSQNKAETKLLNMFGVLIGVFCGLVVYLVTNFEYKRPAEDDHQPLTEN